MLARAASHRAEPVASGRHEAALRKHDNKQVPREAGRCRLMLTSNPFAELSAFVPPTIMQTYIVAMILMVAGGTLLDIMHKKLSLIHI